MKTLIIIAIALGLIYGVGYAALIALHACWPFKYVARKDEEYVYLSVHEQAKMLVIYAIVIFFCFTSIVNSSSFSGVLAIITLTLVITIYCLSKILMFIEDSPTLIISRKGITDNSLTWLLWKPFWKTKKLIPWGSIKTIGTTTQRIHGHRGMSRTYYFLKIQTQKDEEVCIMLTGMKGNPYEILDKITAYRTKMSRQRATMHQIKYLGKDMSIKNKKIFASHEKI